MTDEEKAEEYLIRFWQKNNIVDILPVKTAWDLRCLLIDVIKYVLAEGIKETTEKFSALEKENAELKEYAEKLSEQHADEWQKQQEVITELKAQIEKMKNCENCKYENQSWYYYPCNNCDECDKWEFAK